VADSDDDSLAVIAAAVAAAAGLGVGAAAGAEVGTITGAALAPYLERLAVRGEQMFTAHVDRMSRIAADGLGLTADEFAQHAAATNERLLFTVNAFQAATRTVWEAKLQALGRVLRDGLADDARLDEMPLVLAALDAIEAPHVRVLRTLRDDPSSQVRGVDEEMFVWSADDLAQHFPQFSSGIQPIVATLQRHGCADSVTGGGRTRWFVTDFGRAMLERIENSTPAD
jgi:hypothetical protein